MSVSENWHLKLSSQFPCPAFYHHTKETQMEESHYEIRDCETGKIIKGKEADEMVKPDWSRACEICGSRPIVPLTGMCGPCTFGESETAGGNW